MYKLQYIYLYSEPSKHVLIYLKDFYLVWYATSISSGIIPVKVISCDRMLLSKLLLQLYITQETCAGNTMKQKLTVIRNGLKKYEKNQQMLLGGSLRIKSQ